LCDLHSFAVVKIFPHLCYVTYGSKSCTSYFLGYIVPSVIPLCRLSIYALNARAPRIVATWGWIRNSSGVTTVRKDITSYQHAWVQVIRPFFAAAPGLAQSFSVMISTMKISISITVFLQSCPHRNVWLIDCCNNVQKNCRPHPTLHLSCTCYTTSYPCQVHMVHTTSARQRNYKHNISNWKRTTCSNAVGPRSV
jgi:hypothetical protein